MSSISGPRIVCMSCGEDKPLRSFGGCLLCEKCVMGLRLAGVEEDELPNLPNAPKQDIRSYWTNMELAHE